MRIPLGSGRSGLVLVILVMLGVLSVKYSIDQSYLQVSQLNSQLNVLKARYRELASLASGIVLDEETNEEAHLSSSVCAPKTQVAFAKTHKTGISAKYLI